MSDPIIEIRVPGDEFARVVAPALSKEWPSLAGLLVNISVTSRGVVIMRGDQVPAKVTA